MKWRSELGTFVIVTVVAVLIWTWAAAETREPANIAVRAEFRPPDAKTMVVTPQEKNLTLTIEGTRPAIAAARAQQVVEITPDPKLGPGTHQIDLAKAFEQHEAFRQTGVSINSVSPAFVELTIHELTRIPARVELRLPGIETEGEIRLDPAQVEIELPRDLLSRLPDNVFVEARIATGQVEGLAPGREHTLSNVPLFLPEVLRGRTDVRLIPNTTDVAFSIRSRIERMTLDTVRVQAWSAPENFNEASVRFDEPVLRDVTIETDADLIRAVRAGEAIVVALVHLRSNEIESRIERKRISSFMAIRADGTYAPIDATVGGASELPMVDLSIEDRTGASE